MRESEIERYFNWAVQRLGGRTYKFHSPNNRGVSDRIACLPGGETWFVELKAPRGRLSPLQRVFLDEIKGLGCNYEIVWSKEDVDEWLEKVK